MGVRRVVHRKCCCATAREAPRSCRGVYVMALARMRRSRRPCPPEALGWPSQTRQAGAASAKVPQYATSNACKAEPNQYEQAACRRDEEPAFNDVHGPIPHTKSHWKGILRRCFGDGLYQKIVFGINSSGAAARSGQANSAAPAGTMSASSRCPDRLSCIGMGQLDAACRRGGRAISE